MISPLKWGREKGNEGRGCVMAVGGWTPLYTIYIPVGFHCIQGDTNGF